MGWRGYNSISGGNWDIDTRDGDIDAPCEPSEPQRKRYCSKCVGTSKENASCNGACPKCGGPYFDAPEEPK